MKRSEMIKVIKKVVNKWKDCEFEPRMYDQILKAIEKNGMEPPIPEDWFLPMWEPEND
jgi:hypothetical protein